MVDINKIEEYVKENLKEDKSGHDFEHTLRVIKNAEIISKSLKFDKEVLKIACLLHDIAYKDGKVKDHHILGAKIAEEKLRELDYPEEKIRKVKLAIEDHMSQISAPLRKDEELQIESKILRDADNLDALGAIGIVRMTSFCLSQKRPYFKSKEDGFDETFYGGFKRLLNWHEKMLTEKGREIGKERTKIILDFVNQIEKEFL